MQPSSWQLSVHKLYKQTVHPQLESKQHPIVDIFFFCWQPKVWTSDHSGNGAILSTKCSSCLVSCTHSIITVYLKVIVPRRVRVDGTRVQVHRDTELTRRRITFIDINEEIDSCLSPATIRSRYYLFCWTFFLDANSVCPEGLIHGGRTNPSSSHAHSPRLSNYQFSYVYTSMLSLKSPMDVESCDMSCVSAYIIFYTAQRYWWWTAHSSSSGLIELKSTERLRRFRSLQSCGTSFCQWSIQRLQETSKSVRAAAWYDDLDIQIWSVRCLWAIAFRYCLVAAFWWTLQELNGWQHQVNLALSNS